MPLIVTATGQRIVIHPKLYSLKKTSCHPVGGFGPDAGEGNATIMGTLRRPTNRCPVANA